MGMISDKELAERVSSPSNLINRLSVHKIEKGRPIGKIETPNEIKKVISIITNEGEKAQEVANEFGLSRRVVAGYRLGETSQRPNQELKQVRRETIARIQGNRNEAEDLAIQSVLEVLQVIPEKIKSEPRVGRLTKIAKDMSIIANQMASRDTDSNGNMGGKSVHVHLYAPQQKKVEDYDIIDIESK